MKQYTKESLASILNKIRDQGWIRTVRKGNDGGVGNTLEDLLGIEENNLPLPNTGEWELKCQRADTTSLITLFHMEPSPRAFKFVPRILLPNYGWPHKKAGRKHPQTEMSFRQTLQANKRTDRGFAVVVNREYGRIEVSFDSNAVDTQAHDGWLSHVERQTGLGEIDPQPYWGVDDIFYAAACKLGKTLYAVADHRKVRGVEFFRYSEFLMLESITREKFIKAIESGDIQVDFDARTGHNHGTKFRLKQNSYRDLYDSVEPL